MKCDSSSSAARLQNANGKSNALPHGNASAADAWTFWTMYGYATVPSPRKSSESVNMSIDNREYNGWTNYATWRVALEMFDGMPAHEVSGKHVNTQRELADAAKAYAENWLDDAQGLAYDWAMAFIADVDWREIADYLMVGSGETVDEDEDN